MEEKKTKLGLVLMATGTLLVVIALLLFLFHMYEEQEANKTIEDVIDKIQDVDEDDFIGSDDLPMVEIDGYYYIGYIHVPSIDLTLPVMAQWSEEGLKIAPGVYSGSILTNDCVIAGHNYAKHFSPLKYVSVGTEIIFTTFTGKSISYKVSYFETLEPSEVSKMIEKDEDDRWDLTLFTCTTGGSRRCTIRCVRSGKTTTKIEE